MSVMQRPYRNEERMKAAYEECGTIQDTADYFDIAPSTARKYLVRFELYEPETEGPVRAIDLENASPEDIGLAPIGEGPMKR